MGSDFMRLQATIALAVVAAISAACGSGTSSASPFAGKTPAQVLAMARAALGKSSCTQAGSYTAAGDYFYGAFVTQPGRPRARAAGWPPGPLVKQGPGPDGPQPALIAGGGSGPET